jgi:uracil-DNA glycosylase family 4
MRKVVIIEGADNLGKTTLCNELVNTITKLKRVRHSGPPTMKGEAALREQLQTLKAEVGRILDKESDDEYEVWDRSIFGEAVYGPLFRAGQYNHKKYLNALIEACEDIAQRVLVIVLYTDGEWYERQRIKRKLDEEKVYQQREMAATIGTAFIDTVTALPLKYRLFINCRNYESFALRNKYILKRVQAWVKNTQYERYQSDDYQQVFFNEDQMLWQQSVGFIENPYACTAFKEKTCAIGNDHRKFAQFGETFRRPTSACGSITNVRYIFVGEAPGHKGCGKLGVPFYNDASGNLMQDALDRLRIVPTQYYMTNTVKCCPKNNDLAMYGSSSTRHVYECVGRLKDEILYVQAKNPSAKVIAIGKVAGQELARIGIDHGLSYHPAYYLRIGRREDFERDFRKVLLEI